LNFSLI